MESILQVNHLSKKFGDIYAVDDISFSVNKGEFFSFLGINGAGKSTTINMLCTLFPHSGGDVSICGHTLGKDNVAIRHKIGAVFQGNTLDDRLTIKENLIFRGHLYEKNSRKVRAYVQDVCDILDIGDLLNKRFNSLSGGQKRRCEIARALLHKPEILFLDEPTTGLDPKTKQLVWQCIESLRKEFKMTIFLTTHYMEEAAMASHIGVIHQGKMVADASPFKLKEIYTSDKLRLEVKHQDTVLPLLNASNLTYQITSNCLEVLLPNSVAAIPLLHSLKDEVLAFEVIQGTMEDAFLNLIHHTTKGDISHANHLDAHQKKYETLYA